MPALTAPAQQQEEEESMWSSSCSPEFVAVILAATTGARLFPLTSKQTPKHLLPVAGIPILLRLLDAVASSGFESCIVALAKDDTTTISLLRSMSKPVSNHPNTVFLWKNYCRVTLVQMSEDCSGSAEALTTMETLLPPTSHVVVMPADLIVLNGKVLTRLADVHRQGNLPSNKETRHHYAACTMLLADVGETDEHGVPLKESAKQKKGGLAREEEDIEYIGLSFENAGAPRVVWKQSKIDVEQDEDLVGTEPQLTLPKPRLHCITRVRTDWSDLHVYALSPWVRRWLSTRASALSLQSDVLPLLVSRQFRGVVATFGSEAMTLHKETVEQVLSQPPFVGASMDSAVSPEQDGTLARQSSNSSINVLGGGNVNTLSTIQKHEYSVAAHVLSPSSADSKVLALRASSIPAYLYACREAVSRAVVDPTLSNPCLTLPEKTTLQAKFHSILLEDATTGDKVTCKSSTVGKRSKLGSRCRLSRVVVMDDVVVGDNCVLQNSILGAGCTVGDDCNLNDCQVAPGKVVPSGTKVKGESFFEDTWNDA